MSVLAYLYELHNGDGAVDDESDDQFSSQYAGYSSSGGSISRLNELTIQSTISNMSKNSRVSRNSNQCKKINLHFFVTNFSLQLEQHHFLS